jgi:hypothetical protein
MIVSFDNLNDPQVISGLVYYLAVFDVTGFLVDFRKLSRELMLCPHSNLDA